MKSNIPLLRLMDLPIFSSGNELASLMHIEYGLIDTLSRHSDRYYRKYKISKSNGGLREIRQPRKDVKGIQSWILRNILDKLTPSPFATAYIKNKNIRNNTFPHCNNRYFMCIDLEDFFPSISMRRVTKLFSLIGYSKAAASTLALLCTCMGSLPQGAVTSPSLSNLITGKLDRRIAGYTSRRNIIFTRYADDLTLSSNNPALLCKSLPAILKIIKSEHFKPNIGKFRTLGPSRKCLVTGLVKNNSESDFGIGKKKKKQMRAVMHHNVFSLSKDSQYKSKEAIVGWLNFLKSVDRESSKTMTAYWNSLQEKAIALASNKNKM